VVADPDLETIERYRTVQERYRQSEMQLRELRDQPACTTDGAELTLRANIELTEKATGAMEIGAEGVGLYRTEFLFLSRTQLPSEEEQYNAFKEALDAMGGKPIVFRTLDLGADKLTDSIDAQHDHNPVLGLRSLRFCMRHMDLFKTHLRALLRASAGGDARLMFPMITTLMELRQAKHILGDVMEDLDEEGIPFRRDLPIGMMVETPSAALLCDVFAREVDFFSVGTNDLTQYVLAVDRANERVSHLYSAHNPAVIRLLDAIAKSAQRHEISLSLCGEMAGAPIYTQLLIGLGYRELSMAPKDILEVKKTVRLTSLSRCEEIAEQVLTFDADRQVINYLRDRLREIAPEAL
jgi:phosphotransferase system enzyme I (PtsI)